MSAEVTLETPAILIRSYKENVKPKHPITFIPTPSVPVRVIPREYGKYLQGIFSSNHDRRQGQLLLRSIFIQRSGSDSVLPLNYELKRIILSALTTKLQAVGMPDELYFNNYRVIDTGVQISGD